MLSLDTGQLLAQGSVPAQGIPQGPKPLLHGAYALPSLEPSTSPFLGGSYAHLWEAPPPPLSALTILTHRPFGRNGFRSGLLATSTRTALLKVLSKVTSDLHQLGARGHRKLRGHCHRTAANTVRVRGLVFSDEVP